MNNSRNFKKARKKEIWKKANGRCAHCGAESVRSKTVDHFIPQSRGGTWHRQNLFPLCSKCNRMRGSRKVDPREYYKYATEEAILNALEYEMEWRIDHNSML